MKKLYLLLLAPLLFVWLFIPAVVKAQDSPDEVGLTIRPAIIDLVADKGTTVTSTVTIENISGGAVGVTVDAQSLIPNDELLDQEKRKDTDASTWMINKGKKFLLEVGEIEQVEVQFLVPPDATPGGHYALVTFTTNTNSVQTTTGSKVTPVVSALTFITVSGDIVERAEIGNVNIPFFAFGKTQTLDFDIINDGNVHILPTATVKLYDRGDKLVETTQVPAQLILPNTLKSFIAEWSSANHVGIHRLEIDVTYGTPSQTVSLGSGTIVILPDIASFIFGLSVLVIVTFIILFIFRGPLRRAKKTVRKSSYKFRIRKMRTLPTENKPEDIAGISMDQRKLDDLMSSGGRSKPRQPQKAKKRKIIIK